MSDFYVGLLIGELMGLVTCYICGTAMHTYYTKVLSKREDALKERLERLERANEYFASSTENLRTREIRMEEKMCALEHHFGLIYNDDVTYKVNPKGNRFC